MGLAEDGVAGGGDIREGEIREGDIREGDDAGHLDATAVLHGCAQTDHPDGAASTSPHVVAGLDAAGEVPR